MKKIIKENLFLLSGAGLFIYNLFSFSSDRYCDQEGGAFLDLDLGLDFTSSCYHPATFYYYDNVNLILLTLGIILMLIGILKIIKK